MSKLERPCCLCRRLCLFTAVLGLSLPASTLRGQLGPVGIEHQVNTVTMGQQTLPRVAALPAGSVVVWQTNKGGDAAADIAAQRYDAAGNSAGREFQVNTHTGGCQGAPDVAGAADGSFVVVWQ